MTEPPLYAVFYAYQPQAFPQLDRRPIFQCHKTSTIPSSSVFIISFHIYQDFFFHSPALTSTEKNTLGMPGNVYILLAMKKYWKEVQAKLFQISSNNIILATLLSSTLLPVLIKSCKPQNLFTTPKRYVTIKRLQILLVTPPPPPPN